MFVRSPSPCASLWIDRYRSASHLSCAILRRTRSAKISAPPPGSESSPASCSSAQHLLVGHAVQIGEEGNLDGREALQVNRRADPFEAAQHVRVVLERQVRMQPVDDVDFGQGLMGTAAQLVPDLLERHRVRARITRLEPRERAEQAAGDTDVGRLEADVEVVVRARAVTTFALAVGEPAKRQQVGAGEQPDAVLEIEPHPASSRSAIRCEAEPLQSQTHAVPSAIPEATNTLSY